MGRTIARHKKEIEGVLNKLPEILKDIGIDCNIAVDTSDNFLSVTIGVKAENMPEWITIVRDFEYRTPLVKFFMKLTGELAVAFIGISKELMSSAIRPTASGNCFVFQLYCCNGEKAVSWLVYPKPECIEVEESEVKKEVLSWEEYLRKLTYTIRLVVEVNKGD